MLVTSKRITLSVALAPMFAVLAVSALSGCSGGDAGVMLSAAQRDALSEHGVSDVSRDGELIRLFDAQGKELGEVYSSGPQVTIQLADAAGAIRRIDDLIAVGCVGETGTTTVDGVGSLDAWLDELDDDACRRALWIGRILTGIEHAHAPGCTSEIVDGVERLRCREPEQTEVAAAREALLASSTCSTCAPDDWGWCDASCWECDGTSTRTCYDGDESGGGGGGGGGGTSGDTNICSDTYVEQTARVAYGESRSSDTACVMAMNEAERNLGPCPWDLLCEIEREWVQIDNCQYDTLNQLAHATARRFCERRVRSPW